mmetsp:Transcript_23368/g.55641  ORF Transcript_23368/g.55641 Transcript_23368/m.55641 type:complete len:275 (+) Transcript_23368:5421-6245(+)
MGPSANRATTHRRIVHLERNVGQVQQDRRRVGNVVAGGGAHSAHCTTILSCIAHEDAVGGSDSHHTGSVNGTSAAAHSRVLVQLVVGHVERTCRHCCQSTSAHRGVVHEPGVVHRNNRSHLGLDCSTDVGLIHRERAGRDGQIAVDHAQRASRRGCLVRLPLRHRQHGSLNLRPVNTTTVHGRVHVELSICQMEGVDGEKSETASHHFGNVRGKSRAENMDRCCVGGVHGSSMGRVVRHEAVVGEHEGRRGVDRDSSSLLSIPVLVPRSCHGGH